MGYTRFWISGFQRENNRRRLENGTHPLLSENRSYAFGRNNAILKSLNRAKYYMIFQHLVMIPKSYWEWLDDIYGRRKATREYPSDISDMTDSMQLEFF